MSTTGTVNITDNLDQTRLATFAGLNGASGTSPAFAPGPMANATLIMQGTWDSATALLKGSNDGGTTWFALKDHLGNAISYTANAIFIPDALPLLLQISWSGGDSSTALVAYLGFNKTFF